MEEDLLTETDTAYKYNFETFLQLGIDPLGGRIGDLDVEARCHVYCPCFKLCLPS